MAHGGPKSDVMQLALRVKQGSRGHKSACDIKIQAPRLHHWVPPPVTKVKVNVDAAIRETYAVIVAIIRDSGGVVLRAEAKRIDAVDSLEGEAVAAKLGLELVLS